MYLEGSLILCPFDKMIVVQDDPELRAYDPESRFVGRFTVAGINYIL